MYVWLAVLFALFITMALVPVLRQCALYFHAVDLPNERKVHSQPMAKTGGLAMAIGALVPILIWSPRNTFGWSLLFSCLLIVGFGFIDDLKDLASKTKFGVQFLAALLIVLWGGVKITSVGSLLPEGFLLPDFLAIPLTVFVIVGVTNAINLSDGLDGLAGGISLLSFICIACLAFLAGNWQVTLISATMAGAIFGFLRFNTYPASVFMGDAGSQLLGFLAITLSLSLTQSGTPCSPLLPLLLLGFPILDTLTVMTERIAGGRSPFIADKNHFHHKLMRVGLTHAEAVLVIYFLQTVLILSGYFLRFYSDWLLLSGYLGFSLIILLTFQFANKYNWHFNHAASSRFRFRSRLLHWLNRETAIKLSFRALQFLLPLTLLVISLLPGAIPRWLGFVALALLLGLLLRREKFFALQGALLLRLVIYLVTPVLIYQIELTRTGSWLIELSNLLFILLVIMVVLVIRYTRRAGYRSTPLDYLILLLALLVPNLNLFELPDFRLGMVTAKLLILFFSIEVLLEEMRRNYKTIVTAESLMLGTVVIRAIF